MTLRVERFPDARAFLDTCEASLMQAEVENALFLGLAHALRQATEPPRLSPYFAAVRDGEEILCCAWRTVPDKIGCSRAGFEFVSAGWISSRSFARNAASRSGGVFFRCSRVRNA